MLLSKISVFKNNYIWILTNFNKLSIIIDPGCSTPVIQYLNRKNYYPIAILLTHYHKDHVLGIFEIKKKYPNILILGPQETQKYGVNKIICKNKKFFLLNKAVYSFLTPGHTTNHISYFIDPYLFCGDVLFSGGCGKIFEGTAIQMLNSLKKICSLPLTTLICCGHEYTLSNLKFACSVIPDDKTLFFYYKYVKFLLKKGKGSLPSTLKNEKKINIFLRCDEKLIKKKMNLSEKEEEIVCFRKLRKRKDEFKIF